VVVRGRLRFTNGFSSLLVCCVVLCCVVLCVCVCARARCGPQGIESVNNTFIVNATINGASFVAYVAPHVSPVALHAHDRESSLPPQPPSRKSPYRSLDPCPVTLPVFPVPICTSYVYAGDLPSGAFGINSYGIGFTLNYVQPVAFGSPGVGRGFISRSLLDAVSAPDAMTKINVQPQGAGHNVQVCGRRGVTPLLLLYRVTPGATAIVTHWKEGGPRVRNALFKTCNHQMGGWMQEARCDGAVVPASCPVAPPPHPPTHACRSCLTL
jgi:hypothetical protein